MHVMLVQCSSRRRNPADFPSLYRDCSIIPNNPSVRYARVSVGSREKKMAKNSRTLKMPLYIAFNMVFERVCRCECVLFFSDYAHISCNGNNCIYKWNRKSRVFQTLTHSLTHSQDGFKRKIYVVFTFYYYCFFF